MKEFFANLFKSFDWTTFIEDAALVVWPLFSEDLSGTDKFTKALDKLEGQVTGFEAGLAGKSPLLDSILANDLYKSFRRKLLAIAIQEVYKAQKPVYDWLKSQGKLG